MNDFVICKNMIIRQLHPHRPQKKPKCHCSLSSNKFERSPLNKRVQIRMLLF